MMSMYIYYIFTYLIIKCTKFKENLFLAIPVIIVIKPKDQKEKKIDLQREVSTDLIMLTCTYI